MNFWVTFRQTGWYETDVNTMDILFTFKSSIGLYEKVLWNLLKSRYFSAKITIILFFLPLEIIFWHQITRCVLWVLKGNQLRLWIICHMWTFFSFLFLAKPYFREPLRDQLVDKGSQLTWRCYAAAIPPETYTWFKDGQPLTQVAGEIEIRKNTLVIRNLQKEKHDGMYQCAAKNEYGIAFSSAQLRVLGNYTVLWWNVFIQGKQDSLWKTILALF